jgi:putative ABC transport system permease protein
VEAESSGGNQNESGNQSESGNLNETGNQNALATEPQVPPFRFGTAVITLTPEGQTNISATQTSLADALGSVPNQIQVQTPAQIADQRASAMGGGENLLITVFVGVFAAIALLVAGLVIANTFQVLVAQRTRDLALLRAVGAAKRQVYQAVLWEAFGLGILASLLGMLTGFALSTMALRVTAGMDLGVPLPAHLTIDPLALWLPLLLGTLVTVIAALAPARAATRVAPLAALRPFDAPTVQQRAGKARLVLSLLAVALGFAMLLGGMRLANDSIASFSNAVLLAVAGCIISFLGLVISAVFWLPVVIGWFGHLLGNAGPTAKLAAANTLRNPRRTAATATALLIGTTLVAMMATGAATASATLNNVMDTTFPVDAVIATDQWAGPSVAEPIPAELVREIASLDGVRAAVPLPGTTTEVTTVLNPETVNTGFAVRGVTAADAAAVVRDSAALEGLADGVILVPLGQLLGTRSPASADGEASARSSIETGDFIAVTGPTGTVNLQVIRTSLRETAGLVTPATLALLDDNAATTRVWIELDRIADAPTVIPLINDVVSDSGVSAAVLGEAAERSSFQNLIDTALSVVVGLLAAAVVIALIGVANTLSLSVIERQRESATLRAIGLTAGRLRGMLALEGVSIALVGAALGIVLGLIYGWAGAATVLAQTGEVSLGFPWQHILAAIVIAVGSGLLASVLPGRAAAKQKPVAALATVG